MEIRFRTFIHYTILSILGTLGVSCYILADTFFVSRGTGSAGLAALNLAIPVYNFIHGTGLMLGMGGATKFSVCKGSNDRERIDQIYTNTVYLAFLFSLLFLLIGVFGAGTLAGLLGADQEVFAMTKTYLKWLLIFSPAFIMNDVLLCFVRNDDGPQLSMAAMLAGSFSNIIMDYILIFPCQMGILGAVLATGFSPVISMLMMLPHWTRRQNSFHLVFVKPDPEMIRQDISIGFPSLVGQLSSGIVMITFNGLILGLTGNIGVAAYGVVANLSLVVTGVYTGIAQGVQPLLADAYGRGQKEEISFQFRCAMVTAAGISLLLYLVTAILAEPITGIFNSEQDPRLPCIAVEGLRIYFLSNLAVGYNTVLAIYFTCVEKTLPAHVLSLLRGLVLIVPLAVLMASLWGMTGIWLVYPVTEFAVGVLGEILRRKTNRRKIQK